MRTHRGLVGASARSRAARTVLGLAGVLALGTLLACPGRRSLPEAQPSSDPPASASLSATAATAATAATTATASSSAALGDLNGWPAAGICAWRQPGSPRPCERLFQRDGEQIERALRAHVASEAARTQVAPGDLERAARALGPPIVSLYPGDQLFPMLGRYSVAAAETPGSLEIRNTERVSRAGRWGFSFHLEQRNGAWSVVSFGIWHARAAPAPTAKSSAPQSLGSSRER